MGLKSFKKQTSFLHVFPIFPYTEKQNEVFENCELHWFFWRQSFDGILCMATGKVRFPLSFLFTQSDGDSEMPSYFILIFFTLLPLPNRIVVIS